MLFWIVSNNIDGAQRMSKVVYGAQAFFMVNY